MSRLVVGPSLKSGALIASPLAPPPRRFFVLRHRQRYESLAARAFAELAARFADDGDAAR